MSDHNPRGSLSAIVRGSAWLTATSLLSKILLLAFFVFLSDRLGRERLGRLLFFTDSAFLVFVIADLGLGYLLVQKISRQRSSVGDLLARFLGLRLAMLLPLLVGYGVFLQGFPRSAQWLPVQRALAVSYLLLLGLWDIFRSVVRGYERMDREAISTLTERLVYMGGGTLLLVAGLRLTGMMVMTQVSILFSFGLLVYWILRDGIPIRVRFEPDRWPALLQQTLPFGLGALCIIVFYKEDTVMLTWLRGEEETGIYGYGFRLMEGAQLLPQALALAAYPTFSRLFHEGCDLRPLAEKILRWLMILCFPLAVGGIILAPQLIRLLGPKYLPSIPSFRLLLLALPPIYLNYLFGTLLRSVDRQTLNLASAAVALVTNFVLNLLMIPRYGAVGAAAATIAGQCVYCGLMAVFVYRVSGPLRTRSYLPVLLGVTALMGIGVYLLRNSGLYLSIPAGIIVFFALGYITGLTGREQLRQFVQLFRRQGVDTDEA